MSNALSQDVLVGFEMGYGKYEMQELRSFNQFIASSLPFETKLIDDFPPYYYYRPSFVISLNRLQFGLAWYQQSTGTRYSSEDYTGEYLLDSKIKSYGPSLILNLCLTPSFKPRIYISNDIGYLKTENLVEETLLVGDATVIEETLLLRSGNIFWEPGIRIEYPLKSFILEAHAGYCIQAKGKGLYAKIDGEKNYIQTFSNIVHTEWNGYRFGIGVVVNFTSLGLEEIGSE